MESGNIKKILIFVLSLAVIAAAIIGITLVLNLIQAPEAKEIMTKILSVLAIAAAASLIVLGLLKLSQKNN